MADSKKEKVKKAPVNKKKLDLSTFAVIDNMTFSKKDVWAYYKITNRAYDFLEHEGKLSLIQSLTNSFNNLMTERKEALEGHIIVTSVPIDLDMWEDQIKSITADWDTKPGFDAYMAELKEFLLNEAFHEKIVYIGFNLGKRGALNLDDINPFSNSVKGAVETIKEWGQKALMLPTEEIDEDEEDRYRKTEETLFINLSNSHLQAQRTTAEDILLLIKRQFYPMMATPYLDVDHGTRIGAGDIALETTSVVEKNYRWLRFEQESYGTIQEGYRATLSLSKFPKKSYFPGQWPFLYFVDKNNLPFTTFSRFKLLPNEEVRKKHYKKTQEQADEYENLRDGMRQTQSVVSGTPEHFREGLEASQEIASDLSQDKGTAWFEGSFYIVIETSTKEDLLEYANMVKQDYADLEIKVQWTSGDQTELFLSQMPGDRHRMDAFDQVASLNILAASGFNFSSEVGDTVYGTQGRTLG